MALVRSPINLPHPINCLEWLFEIEENPNSLLQNGMYYKVNSLRHGELTRWIPYSNHGRFPLRLGPELFKDLLTTDVPDLTLRDTVVTDEGFSDYISIRYKEFTADSCSGEESPVAFAPGAIVVNSYNNSDEFTYDNLLGQPVLNYPLTLRPKNFEVTDFQFDWIWSFYGQARYRFYDCDDNLLEERTLEKQGTSGITFVFPVGTANLTIPAATTRYEVRFIGDSKAPIYYVSIKPCQYHTLERYGLIILEPQGGYTGLPVRLISSPSEVSVQTYCESSQCKTSAMYGNSGEKILSKRTKARRTYELAVNNHDPEFGLWMSSLSSGSRAFEIKSNLRDGPVLLDQAYTMRELIIDQALSGFDRNSEVATFSGYLTDVYHSKGWR